jgi:multimeric flavodoxin WrbA
MKVIAFNGGPRKTWNTATLLGKALEGAAAEGAETELIHLYGLNYKGCISCFACKRKGGESYGKCALKDDLTPIFEKVEQCDAILLGSPVYLGEVAGELRSFLERLAFQYLVYDKPRSTLFKRRIKVGFIYTMNIDDHHLAQAGYEQHFRIAENAMTRIFGETEALYSTDTQQFDDYSNYLSDLVNVE